MQRVSFGRKSTDTDPRDRLTPGNSAEGFVVDAQWRPGLIRVTAIGHKPLPWEPGYTGDEELDTFAGTISEGLLADINKALSTENNSVTVYTIGPKVAPSVPNSQAVRSELLQALRLPEFAGDRQTLMETASLNDLAGVRDRLRKLSEGASGLRAQFYSAMLSYLP